MEYSDPKGVEHHSPARIAGTKSVSFFLVPDPEGVEHRSHGRVIWFGIIAPFQGAAYFSPGYLYPGVSPQAEIWHPLGGAKVENRTKANRFVGTDP